jgi:DAACS family dicarboxylate/amino acid:cation (Na+ or H+) symporter
VEAVRGQSVFSVETVVNIVPRNPLAAAAAGDMLPVIFFSLLFGFALTQIDARHRTAWIDLLRGLGDATVVIINLAMRIAPYGVFALIFAVTARFGLDILGQLSAFVATVLIGLLLHFVIVYGLLVRWLVGMNPWLFLKKVKAAIITAFSTSSSSATLPTTMKVCQEELGVPAPIAGFVLPLGATLNMDGTALFEGVTAIFLAQVFGIDLSLLQQLTVVVLAVITSIGAAGVPGGSIPLLVLVISAIGVPPEGIAIIIGVDRLLDMCRTAVNVTGDTVRAAFVGTRKAARDIPVVL